MPLAWACLSATPVGMLSVGCRGGAVARVRFGAPPSEAAPDPAQRAAGSGKPQAPPGQPDQPGQRTVLDAACAQLAEYLAGQRRAFQLPVDWGGVPPLHQDVLAALQVSVGYGQTVTYGELARRAGLAGRVDLPARAVGQIMRANPVPLLVPCHRVLASDGLGGYSGGAGPEVKRWLLILEGALPPTLDWRPAPTPQTGAAAGQVRDA